MVRISLFDRTGGAHTPPVASPSPKSLRWLIGLRLVVVSTLFVGILLIQVNTQLILPLGSFYGLILLAYGLSLFYLMLDVWRVSPHLQAIIQLVGDLVVVTGFVYVTGGVFSQFSFLYLTVIVVAAAMVPAGGLVFAGLSAIAYGLQAVLMYHRLLPLPTTLDGVPVFGGPTGAAARRKISSGGSPEETVQDAETVVTLLEAGRQVVGPPEMKPELTRCLEAALLSLGRNDDFLSRSAQARRPIDLVDGATVHAILRQQLDRARAFVPVFSETAEKLRP